MIGFCPLSSGSKGNCLYLGSEKTRILIDAGISCRAIEQKLKQLDIDITSIDAVLVTHEHNDHIKGLKILCKKYAFPILCNGETAKGILELFPSIDNFKIFSTGEDFEFGNLEISPFSIPHDALDPVGFSIFTDEIKIGICTDLGFFNTLIAQKLKFCNYLYVESNHKPEMVHACNRPMFYKQRVLSRTGHLSNIDCAKLIHQIYHKKLVHVYLAHLSDECNSPEVALNQVNSYLIHQNIEISLSIAHQNKISQPVSFSKLKQLI